MKLVLSIRKVVKAVKRKVRNAVAKMTSRGRSDRRGDGAPPRGGGNGRGTSRGGQGGGRGAANGIDDLSKRMESLGGFAANADGSKSLHVIANHFQINLTGASKHEDFKLHQFHLTFTPPELPFAGRKTVLKIWQQSYDCGGMLFDGREQLYCTKIWSKEDTVFSHQFDTNTANPVQVKIRYTTTLRKDSPVYTQIYNLVLKQCMFAMGLDPIGAGFYDCKRAIKFEDLKLELWPGYQVSVVTSEQGPVLCVDLVHKVIHQEDVLTLINSLKNSHALRKVNKPLDSYILENLKSFLLMTPYNKECYKIDSVHLDKSPMSTFTKRDGSEINYIKYYYDRYQIRISDKTQPLLESHFKSRKDGKTKLETVFLVPELLTVTGLSDEIRSNMTVMKKLGHHLHMEPSARVEGIKTFLESLTGTEDCRSLMNKWGVSFSTNLLKCVPGKVFPREAIYFAGERSFRADDKNDWTRALRDNKMYVSVPLKEWIVVTAQRDERATIEFIQAMVKVGGPLGLTIAKPLAIETLRDVRTTSYVRFLDDLSLQKYPGLQLVFCVLPNNGSELYNAIKKRLTKDLGVPSQCIISKTMSKGLSVATKVAVQINAKLGGEPWKIKLPPQMINHSMAIGLSTVGKSSKTGVLVATINADYTRYFSVTFQFHEDEDFNDQLISNIHSCLEAYSTSEGKVPTCVVLYRHNVEEGSILRGFVEMNAKLTQKGIQDWWEVNQVPETETRFLYITVGKSANTRIMSHTGNCEGLDQIEPKSAVNPPPGTVVDKGLVSTDKYKEFFMVPTTARQGTVRAIHYRIILETGDVPPQVVQGYTNKLCHLYYNWSGSVNLPSVIQYAAKYAKQKTQVLPNQQAHRRLSSVLHYL